MKRAHAPVRVSAVEVHELLGPDWARTDTERGGVNSLPGAFEQGTELQQLSDLVPV